MTLKSASKTFKSVGRERTASVAVMGVQPDKCLLQLLTTKDERLLQLSLRKNLDHEIVP